MSPVGGDAKFSVTFTAKGVKEILASVSTLSNRIRGTSNEVKRTTRNTHELGRSFRNIALRTVAYLGIVRGFSAITGAFRDATQTGLEYNETIEQSRLAIASLITAQADLYDSTGRQIQGVEALDAAYDLATDQVRKLRIAGIQTAATTKELVDAFQQAVGAGLATGLSLDEIRVVTIRIAQAAGALGVPYRQLNEEIRSILGGIIDQNTRIAKALGIQNEQVRLAKEQGRLAEFLLEKFEAFGIAGERIVETWAALKSNVAETFELFAGEATLPLFETVRTRGLSAVQRIFDFDTAEISKEFEAIVRKLQSVFAGVGDSIAGAFERALDAAVNINYWIRANEDAIDDLIFQTGELVRGFSEVVTSLTKITVGLVRAGVEAGVIQQVMETVADTMKLIARSPLLSFGLLTGLGLGFFAIVNAVLGPTAVLVGGVATALLGLAAAYDAAHDSAAEYIIQEQKANEIRTQNLSQVDENAEAALRLAKEYDALKTSLRSGTIETDRVEEANQRLRSILERLLRLNPQYAEAIRNAADEQGEYEEAVRAVIQAELELNQAQRIANLRQRMDLRQRRREIQEELDTIASRLEGFENAGTAIQRVTQFLFKQETGSRLREELAEINQLIQELGESDAILAETSAALSRLLLGEDFEVRGRPGEGEDTTDERSAAIETEIARIQERLKLREQKLKDQLERNLISYIEYYDLLNLAQVRALNQQIRLREEQAAIEADDPKKQGRAEIQILQLKTQLQTKYIQNELARRQQEIKFAQEAGKIEVGILKAIGDSAEATRQRLTLQYQEYRDDLIAMGEAGKAALADLDVFIGFEVARETLSQYEETLARAQTQTRAAITEIEQLRSAGALGQREAQELIAAEYEKLLETMRDLLPLMREQAELLGDPEALAVITELEAQMRGLDRTVTDLRDHWKEFREDVGAAAAQELARYLRDAVVEAESLGDAFNNLVGSLNGIRNLLGKIAEQIVELTARAIALKIIQSIGFPTVGAARRGGLVAPASIAGPILSRAGGGEIRGPGTSTSDSILARLSTGEFVVRADAVRKYGTDFFHALNQGAMPRDVRDLKRYATGGLVGSDNSPSATKEFKGTLTVGLSEGLVLEQLDTPAGERMVLKVINKNRRGILSTLGG